MESLELLEQHIFMDHHPITTSLLANNLKMSGSEASNLMKKFYSLHFNELKGIFSISLIEDNNKLTFKLVNQEELLEILNDSKQKDNIVDLSLFGLLEKNSDISEFNHLFENSIISAESNIMCLTNEMRSLTVHNTSNIMNNTVQKSITSNQTAKSNPIKKVNAIQPEIVNPPILKKVKHEENQVKSIKTENPKSKDIKPFFSQGTKKPEEVKEIKTNSKKNNDKCEDMEEEEECYYGEAPPKIIFEEKNKIEPKESEKKENAASKQKIFEPPKSLSQPKKIEINSQENKINLNAPNEEGLIPRKRKVKKTIEEVNEKGKIISRDVMVEEIYYEKKEKTFQSQPMERSEKVDKNKPAQKKNQSNIMNFFAKK